MTVREALRDAMAEEMRRDEDVFVMGEEVAEYQGAYKITQGLLQEFGAERVVDTPITEHGFAGLGVGAAMAGLKPIVEFMTCNFAMQAIDQIINSAAKTLYMSGGQMGAPIVFRGPNGAAARVAAQHSQDYAAWYSHVPGLKVVAPYTRGRRQGPAQGGDPRPQPGDLPRERDPLRPVASTCRSSTTSCCRSARRASREPGKDVTIVSFGIGMSYAMKAEAELAGIGIDAELIDLRTLRPMDIDTVIDSVKKTNRCVTVEEGLAAVLGSATDIASQRDRSGPSTISTRRSSRVTGKDVPMPYAANLEKLALPTSPKSIEAVKAVTYRLREGAPCPSTSPCRPFADHGGGQARQVAGQGRRQRLLRRRHRRDRDRQGDDGGRGGRRGHDRPRSSSRRAPRASRSTR